MATNIFSIKEALSVGWKLVWKHFWLFLGSLACMFGLMLLPQAMIRLISFGPVTSLLIYDFSFARVFQLVAMMPVIIGLIFLVIALNIVMRIGLVKMTIKIIRHEAVSFKDLFIHYKHAINYFLGSMLYGFIRLVSLLVVAWLFGMTAIGYVSLIGKGGIAVNLILAMVALAGFILVIIPIVYFLIEYAYFSFFTIDHNTDPVAAFKKSARLTRNLKLKLLGFSTVLALVNLLGLLAIGVGLLVTIPLTMLAKAYVYDTLSKRFE